MINNPGKFVHALEIPVRWHDMDAYGHVNNSTYFTYFESTRIDWWMTIIPQDMTLLENGPVIVNAQCTFQKAVQYPETLLVKLHVGPPGRSSYECFYEIYSKQQPDILYATGSTKIVWVDRKLGQSTPLPDYIRKHLPEK